MRAGSYAVREPKTVRALFAALVLTACVCAAARAAEPELRLKAGAAKVDITPDEDALPGIFKGVLDPLFVRAIVIGDGKTKAALVTVDAGAVRDDVWEKVSARAERELGVPAAHMLLTATHTHSAPFVREDDFSDRIFEAVKQAASDMKPARMAFGEGVSYINVNRDMVDPKTGRWREGPNYDGASDKTVAILSFDDLSGKSIAIYYNYGVHAVITGTLDLVSGDIPGAASAYIEDSLGGGAVAVWSTGASGDQNPIFFRQTYDLREIRIAEYAKRGVDISNAMPPGGQGMDRSNPEVARLMAQQKQMILSMGQMLGEEVLHVRRTNLARPETSARIVGAQRTVACPGRRRTDEGRAGYTGTYVDAGPVDIRLSLLKFGDIVVGGVNAEVFTLIAQRFKREAPYKHAMMATLTNGMAQSGYIPDDAAFGYNTFEVLSTRLKPGCAESAIVNGLLDMTGEADQRRK